MEKNNIGVVSIEKARELAQENGLDLVEVAPDTSPPVCRILDYGKLKYQQKKKHQQKKKVKVQQKELRFRPRINEHDIQVKLNLAKKFLEHGYKIFISMSFKGRERAHLDVGRQLMYRIMEELEPISQVDQKPKMERNKLSMLLQPKK